MQRINTWKAFSLQNWNHGLYPHLRAFLPDDCHGNLFVGCEHGKFRKEVRHNYRSRRRTPGPLPLASMKITPAASRAVRMAVRLLAIGVLLPPSNSAIVALATPATSDSLPCDQFNKPLAPRDCSGDNDNLNNLIHIA
ncbi:hypothetical protein OIU34_27765 [Pararhizobium sp. BT-229]|nr:hypothetical protein [Pararhizobium sp. BT-229]MCV9965675.1 hypothetical protein [Pararhizobium sp. BT-229]